MKTTNGMLRCKAVKLSKGLTVQVYSKNEANNLIVIAQEYGVHNPQIKTNGIVYFIK